jgi:predicted transport protein
VEFVKLEPLSIQAHPELNEKWVQERIAEDPSILGLGELVLRDKERHQPRAGRLDLLLQDQETNKRFEVEIQLGPTDESHIIRTIEYWDIEKKRYPQYDHYAVIVAEDVTSRFLNVISLFNGFIPIIAIQMKAFRLENSITLVFTKVMDAVQLGLEEDEESQIVTDRNYWESRALKKYIQMMDRVASWLKEIDGRIELKYNKFYVGLARDGIVNNFVSMKPKKTLFNLLIRIPRSEEIDRELEDNGLVFDYDSSNYRITFSKEDIQKYQELITKHMRKAYEIVYMS